ncbi:MAG: CoA-binding protein [Candidatus Omnitrophica bacterium]|nr:CoA-binding protein [Candidatus Omnitrophota bacterium]
MFFDKVLIFRNLIEKGYKVFPVNPRMNEVDGKICYKSVIDIPFEVEVANLVTPPSITDSVVKDCFQKRIKKVWMQSGAESQAAIKFCNDNNMEVIYGVCVMLESLK